MVNIYLVWLVFYILLTREDQPLAAAFCPRTFTIDCNNNYCKKKILVSTDLLVAPPEMSTDSSTSCPSDAIEKVVRPQSRFVAEQHQKENQNGSTLPAVVVAANLIVVATVLPVMAVDHPVDFSHLSIPNRIPDADPRYFISGGLCAAASHGVTTPLDVVKTRIQSEPELFNKMSLANAAATIVQQDGPLALLNGFIPTIIGYGVEGALKFGLYESLKPTFVQLLSLGDPTEGYLFASVTAGAVASIVLCPMEQTRIRLVTDPTFADGFIGCITRLTKEEGVETIFFGLPAMLLKQVPYTMAKQVSFDMFATFLYSFALQYSLTASTIRTEVEFLAAFFASILACLASHPGDVVLTATYKSGKAGRGGFINIVSSLYDQKGFNAFFSGITARFFHVGAIITSQLVLYDFIKTLLGLPATGTQ